MKTDRHNAIKDLLVETVVTNQDELRRKLAGQGIHVTQATLSRDIRELKLLKGPDGYELPEDDAEDDDMPAIAGVLENFGIGLKQAQNLIVIHTTMGGAQPVAASIDYEEFDEVIGTIAGDNAVLVICADLRNADEFRKRMEAYLA
jgi:transcriptional regulator of arginine metabolism